jgi:hypothetical protein
MQHSLEPGGASAMSRRGSGKPVADRDVGDERPEDVEMSHQGHDVDSREQAGICAGANRAGHDPLDDR